MFHWSFLMVVCFVWRPFFDYHKHNWRNINFSVFCFRIKTHPYNQSLSIYYFTWPMAGIRLNIQMYYANCDILWPPKKKTKKTTEKNNRRENHFFLTISIGKLNRCAPKPLRQNKIIGLFCSRVFPFSFRFSLLLLWFYDLCVCESLGIWFWTRQKCTFIIQKKP